MKKRTLLFYALAFISLCASAAILSPGDALKRVSAVNGRFNVAARNSAPIPVATISSDDGNPALYVFDSPSGGSLFVAASDAVTPLLGYTVSGSFSLPDTAEGLSWWLEEYAAQIRLAECGGASRLSAPSYPLDWEFIPPMVKSKWNQMAPFNKDLPSPNYATGCVATAMAQIMYFWRYPVVGHGENSYSFLNPFFQYEKVSMDFSALPFDWDNMLDVYTEGNFSQTQASAVAYLMKACAVSANTTFGGSSSTQVELAATAFPTFFGYDSSIQSLKRNDFTATEWATILYDQLKNVGPVLYTGNSLYNFAHAFVADGYDGAGYFHINWGWSGLSDGYFLLDALNPPVQSTGGSQYGGYNFSQGMIVNIRPSQGSPSYRPEAALSLLGNLSGSVSGSTLTLALSQANPGNIINNSLVEVADPVFGVSCRNLDSDEVVVIPVDEVLLGGQSAKVDTIPPGGYVFLDFAAKVNSLASLPDGRFEVALVWKSGDGDWQRFIMSGVGNDYVFLTRSGDLFSVENLPLPRFSILKAELLTPLFLRNPVEIRFTLSNDTDYELTQSIIPQLYYNGKLNFEANTQLVSVPAHTVQDVTLVYSFGAMPGATSPTPTRPREYTLGAFDYSVLLDAYYSMGEYGDSYYGDLGTVSMSSPGNNTSFQLQSLSIANASEVSEDLVYGVDSFSDIEVSVSLEAVNGFMASPVYIYVREFDPVSGSLSDVVYQRTSSSLAFAYAGEVATFSSSLDLSGFDTSSIYEATVCYMNQNDMVTLGSVHFGASSGVGSVSDDFVPVSVEFFDLAGRRVASPSRGIFIVRSTDASGSIRTTKSIIK